MRRESVENLKTLSFAVSVRMKMKQYLKKNNERDIKNSQFN